MSDFFGFDLTSLFWPVATLVIGFFAYQLLQKFFTLSKNKNTNVVLQRQLTNIVFMLLLIIVFVLVLPIKDSLKNQIIGLIGIVLSASIALSSATFLGNIMAGIWLRSVRNFRLGDFIEVKDMFGRVSGRGLLHTELQDRERDLITLPNLFLATNPVTVMHSDGTIISTEVSLGYDNEHQTIEPLLLEAAKNAELEKPFVYIEKLLDHAIVYKIHGLATDINTLLSSRSKLNACVLDSLHQAGIEIVSPIFRNQRMVDEKTFIPEAGKSKKSRSKKAKKEEPESVIFDKANKAEQVDQTRQQVEKLEEAVEEMAEQIKETSDSEQKDKLKVKQDKAKEKIELLKEKLVIEESELNKEGKGED
ncbi:mechanosensitive ion channel family protein [Kangiella sediminilitoris]|uniref:Small-conductance mechanosensitive channel n=1 Tax=Kangiella sediminilitoris TaxID=1144748 RepID=A0A1B3B8U8_9GAMM|nr:mechanosensitive ion channel family protein [Kangiella sediminilitoris]AOE49205.1 MscS Mechanosensitive ion channel [Kangiella sediminilitoris]